MNKIVITGATSFIGVHLIDEWLKENCEIIAVVRPNTNNLQRIPNDKRVRIVELGMEDYDELPNYISEADYFYHLAWEGARAPYRDDKSMQNKNYEYTLNAFESAARIGCTFFMGSGSQAEYGLTSGLVDELYPCHPNTEYGREKLHACEVLSKKAKELNLKFIWIRIFSLYGKYDYNKTLIMSALEKCKNNELIEMTPCTQLWDYLNVADAAKAMKLFALNSCESGIYNIASGVHRPLREFVEEIKAVTNSESILAFGAVNYGASGPVNLTPNINKVKLALNWEPKIDFCGGIKQLCSVEYSDN